MKRAINFPIRLECCNLHERHGFIFFDLFIIPIFNSLQYIFKYDVRLRITMCAKHMLKGNTKVYFARNHHLIYFDVDRMDGTIFQLIILLQFVALVK